MAAVVISGWTFSGTVTAQVAASDAEAAEVLVCADNFGFVSQSPQAVADSIGAAVGWADALRVELSLLKSWWWGTRPEISAMLGRCVHWSEDM